MIIHALNPVAITLGSIEIRHYSLMYLVGLIVTIAFLGHFQKTDKHFPLKKNEIFDLVFWGFLGLFIGARLGGTLLYHPTFYLSKPLELFAIWKGGMSFHGGLLGTIIAVAIFCRTKKISPLLMGDYLVIPLAVALFFGRIGNYINGELWGRVTENFVCIDYSKNPHLTNAPEGCRHPSQWYEAIKNVVIFFVLWKLYEKWHTRKTGTLFFVFLLLYGTLRTLIEFVREPAWVFLNITAGQWFSLPLILVGIVGLLWIQKKARN